MSKRPRMTRQVRAYEETAQLIEALVRLHPEKKFADVLEEWATALYPDVYQAIKEKNEIVVELLDKQGKQ